MAVENNASIWQALELVNDPEVPVLSVVDLGIVREVNVTDGNVEVVITPTYSGCPAMDMITSEISDMLKLHGYKDLSIRTVLSPVWTTDWMSEAGRKKLLDYGIAPPKTPSSTVECPQCNSSNTDKISEFGSTSCKALYRCLDCLEPFDHFKCI